MDYRSYMKRIQIALEKIKAADKIQESPWQEVVVRELNEISKDCAKELQTETGQIGNKGDYQLGLDEWPPTRILSLMLAEFKPNLTVNDGYKIAIHAIAAAIRRNAGTGDNINAVIIDKDGYRELSKEMKKSVGAVY